MCGVLQRFWSSLSGKYGNKFYWQDNGQEAAIVNAVRFSAQGIEGPCASLLTHTAACPHGVMRWRAARRAAESDCCCPASLALHKLGPGVMRCPQVSAIDSCIREPQGRGKCAKVRRQQLARSILS